MRMQSKELTKPQAIIRRNGTRVSEYFLRNSAKKLEEYFLYDLEIEEENEVLVKKQRLVNLSNASIVILN